MIIDFKIPIYQKVDTNFIITDYDNYKITFLKGKKIHQLRIVVNGYLTKQIINLVNPKESYKKIILLSIKEYKQYDKQYPNIVTKTVKLEFIKQFYSKQIVTNIQNYLLKINKEMSRDKLTEFGLI